jgi:hypothetical protein
MVPNWAAMPLEKATAMTPPSSAATRFSKTSTVGEPRRLVVVVVECGVAVKEGGGG